MMNRFASTVARCHQRGACVCPGCSVSALRRTASLFAASSSSSAVSPILPSSHNLQSRRPLHSVPVRLQAASKPPSGSSSLDDLDDLFGEEQAVAPSASRRSTGGSSSRLTQILTDTRSKTQATSAAHAAASAIEQDASALAKSLAMLDPSNPPRLEPKHMRLLKVAMNDTQRELQNNQEQERQANPGVEPPTNPVIEHLQKRLTVIQNLVSSLFPPEVPGVPFDENATADILDFAESMPGVLNVMTPDQVDPMKLMAVNHKTTRQNRHLYCLFCKPETAVLEKNQLEYTNLNLLTQFVNERGMIMERAETRLCMIHQRKLARTIKRARNIGLMSPSSNWRVDPEFVYGPGGAFNPTTAGKRKHDDEAVFSEDAFGLSSKR